MERYQPDQYGRMMPDAHGQWVSLRAAELTALDAAQKSSADAQATIAALTKELEQEKQNAFGLAATQCDDPIPGEYGHKLCGTVMEKDRRIAALQAQLKELESELGCPTWVCDCCGRVSSMGWINIVNETMDGTDYDMECPNCHTRQIEEDSAADLVKERDEFESQLTQRTEELEAAKGKLDIILRVSRGEPDDELAVDYGGLGWENDPAVLGVYNMKAELERVRGLVKTYADAKIDFDDKRLQEDHHAWRERYNKLVEAENALLQHRQGMEG